MSRNLINVVEEFRRSPEVQHRKNAVTALAVIADEEATAKLVEVALTDVEPGVRERAEQEIILLGPDVQHRVIEIAIRGLEDTKKRQAAYVTLGRLRSNGWDIPFSRTPLLTWLRLSLGLNGYLYPLRNWKFRTRAWKHGLLGGLAAVAFLAMIFLRSWKLSDYGALTVISVVLVFVSPVIAILATQRTSPIGLYVHHLLGFLTEVLTTWFFASVWFIGLLAIYLFLTSGRFGARDEWVLLMPLILGIFVAAVRSGTLIAYGRFVNRRWNWLAQIVMGVAIGTLALTITNYIGWRIDPNRTVMGMMGPLWIMLFPTSLITANAFAAIDNETSPVRPLIGRLGTALCILILVPFLAIISLIFISGRNAFDEHYRGPTLNRIFEKIAAASLSITNR